MCKMNRNMLAAVATVTVSLCLSAEANAGPYVRHVRHRPAYVAYQPRYYAPSLSVTYARPRGYVTYAPPYATIVRPATRVIYEVPRVQYVVPVRSEPSVVWERYSSPTRYYVAPPVRSYYEYRRPYGHRFHSFGVGFGYGGYFHRHYGGFGFRLDL
jgi:hypothetical protein